MERGPKPKTNQPILSPRPFSFPMHSARLHPGLPRDQPNPSSRAAQQARTAQLTHALNPAAHRPPRPALRATLAPSPGGNPAPPASATASLRARLLRR